MKALVVLFFFALGILLALIGLLGSMGVWDKMLFVSLDFTRKDVATPLILIGIGFVSVFVSGVIMRTK